MCLIEIKGGATINSDYLKHIKNFSAQGSELNKFLFYTGKDSIAMGDVKIVGWNDLLVNLDAIVET